MAGVDIFAELEFIYLVNFYTMVKLKQATKYDAIKHKYKKTSIGKGKIKTSTMNKHKRRRLKRKFAKK